jgi:predicted transcriptional regulator
MPKQVPSESSVISLRLSDALLDRLDHYLDWIEVHQQRKLSRNHVLRLALTQWLEAEEAKEAMTHPDVLQERLHATYNSLRKRKNGVAIHRLRQLLNWPADRFDAVLEHLRAESKVVLHRGDPRRLSDEEQRLGYEVHGQFYVTLSWQD